MMDETNRRQSSQQIKMAKQANKTLSLLQQTYTKIMKDYIPSLDDGLSNMNELFLLNQQTKQPSNQSFFSSVPSFFIDEQIQQRISNLKTTFVSSRRRDELFKKQRKQQEEKIQKRRKQIDQLYKFDVPRILNGEFTIKRGELVQTCSITSKDLLTLQPQTDLNDTIIANYLKFLQVQVLDEQVESNTFIFSSFLIDKLIADALNDDPVNMSQKEKQSLSLKLCQKVAQNYKQVKRWTKRVDIFEKDYLVIPINCLRHWWCIIVVNPGALLIPNPTKKAYMIYCDSMYEKKSYFVDIVRTYLQVELEDKKSKKILITGQNLKCYQLLIPRQTNCHDCGMYMLVYAQKLLTNRKQMQNLNIVANRQKLHLFPRNLIFSMRQRLKQLFVNLVENPDENVRRQIIKKYHEQTKKIVESADKQTDFDRINSKQFVKFKNVTQHMMENSNNQDLDQQQLEFACKIKYYLDTQINFYFRGDKPAALSFS